MQPMKAPLMVKNTFLELDEGARSEALQRANTVPAPASNVQDLLEDEEEEEATEVTEQPKVESNIYKTMTFDSFENGDDWLWLNRQQLEAVEEHHDEAPGDAPQEFVPEEAPCGMMFIPMDLVMPVQPDMYPGCFAVPMDRFGRFPAPEGGLPDFTPLGVTTTADNKRAQVLQRTFSLATNIYRIRWTVDARKLKSTDKEAVSPQFEISFSGGNVPFKMIMRPRAVAQERGGASFKRSRGRGNLQLRCMAESDTETKPVVTFRLSVGSEKAAKQLKPRGPVRHDFSEKNICGLPSGQDDWDFGKAVDEKTQTFVVCLEILSDAQ